MEPAPQPTTEASSWRLRDVFFIYLGAFAGSALALFAAIALGIVDDDILTSRDALDEQLARVTAISAVAQFGAMYVGLQVLSHRRGSGNFVADFRVAVSRRDWVYFLYGAAANLLALITLGLIFQLLNFDPPTQGVVEAGRVSDDLIEKATILVMIALVAPVLEEILFRGVLLDALKARMALNPAVWVTAVVFGVVHLADLATLPILPALILLGAILGYVRERGGGSLSRPILMHMGFNTVSATALVLGL